MMQRGQRDELIQNIVGFLQFLQENQLDPDQVLGQGPEKTLGELPLPAVFQSACETMQFMNEMPGGFLIYRACGQEEILYANRAVQRIFLCESMAQFRALTGGSFRGLVHPEDLEAVEESIQTQIVSSPHDLDYVEYRIIRRDGSVRWLEDYGHFVHSKTAGDLFYVFLSESTERRQQQLTERAVLLDEKRRGEQQMQALLEKYQQERDQMDREHLRRLEVIRGLGRSYDSIFYVDLERDRILPYLLSERGGPLFHDKLESCVFSDIMARYLETWVHPEDRALFRESTDPVRLRERLQTSRDIYVNFRICQGEEVQYLQLRIVSASEQARNAQVIMGYRRMDEELRRELEQKRLLAEALEQANLAVQAKDAFLSHISHDMRTPLNAILGFLTLAKGKLEEPDTVLSYLERTEKAGRQLLDMISRLLELTALSGDTGVEERACDLCETVREVYESLQLQARGKSLDFTLDCGGIKQSGVYADQEKLKQMLFSLASNAVTYTRSGGKVRITVTQTGTLPNDCGVYRFQIADTGIGIDESFLNKIYEPFSREKTSTLSGIHGAGLGLTIVKSIVDRMDGSIDVRSRVDEGTVFTITLRFRLQEVTSQTAPQGAPPFRRILLVEDNEINAEIETELLEQEGFLVETAENGQAALDRLLSAPQGAYDLILMDLQMPVMDGWEASRAIRSLPDPVLAGIPIIALSANAMESDRRKSRACGIDEHLTKPMDLTALLDTMGALSRRRVRPVTE